MEVVVEEVYGRIQRGVRTLEEHSLDSVNSLRRRSLLVEPLEERIVEAVAAEQEVERCASLLE